MRKADMVTSLAIIIISGFFLLQTAQIKSASGAILGPRFFPYIVLLTIIVLSLAVLFFACKQTKNDDSSEEMELNISGKVKVIVTIFISFIYVLLLEKIGFVFASILFMSVLGLFFYGKFDKKAVRIVIFSCVSSWALFSLFTRFFHTLLP